MQRIFNNHLKKVCNYAVLNNIIQSSYRWGICFFYKILSWFLILGHVSSVRFLTLTSVSCLELGNEALNIQKTNGTQIIIDFLCRMTYPHGNISMEVQTLRKALNFPVHYSGPTSLSTEWFDKTKYGSKNGLDHLTDSGYSSRMSAQSTSDIQNSEALGYSSLGFDSNSNQVRHNSSFSNHDVNPWGTSFNSPRVFERSLKSSFDESERLVLLEKLREAHLTIQVDYHYNLFFCQLLYIFVCEKVQ